MLLNFGHAYPYIYYQSLLYSIGIFLSYNSYNLLLAKNLQRFYCIQNLFKSRNHYLNGVVLRALQIFVCYGIAYSGIYLLDVMSFSGGLVASYMIVFLPLQMYLKVYDKELSRVKKIGWYLFMFVGLICTWTSLVMSVISIVTQKRHQ